MADDTVTVAFKPGTDTTYTFPPAPEGYVYGTVTVVAKGGDGGMGALAGSAGLGATASVAVGAQPGGQLHIVVGTTGTAGDAEEKESAPGGFPGGGDGVQGGGGGGGFSAVCQAGVDPETDPAVTQNCLVIAAGGGGSGGQPAMEGGGIFGGGGTGFSGDEGDDGGSEGSAGPGRGGGGAQSGAGGSAGTAGMDAHPGERGLPGQDHQGGVGGTGGTDGGGGGGGGGGASGGQGGGGGGSCSVNEKDSCPDGYAGGGGGAGGVSIRAGKFTGNGEPYVKIEITETPASPAATASPTPALAQTGPPAGSAGASTSSGGGQTVSVPLTCVGAAGGTCDLTAAVSVTETIRNGKVIAVSAKHRKTRKRTVRLGLTAVALKTGQSQTVAIRLNRAGRKLLKKRKRLSVRVKVTQRSAGKPRAVSSAKLTLGKP